MARDEDISEEIAFDENFACVALGNDSATPSAPLLATGSWDLRRTVPEPHSARSAVSSRVGVVGERTDLGSGGSANG